MSEKASRRGFLATIAATGTVAGGFALGGTSAPAANAATAGACTSSLPPVELGKNDPRYQELNTRGYNARFSGQPESLVVVHSAKQIARVVTEAVRAGKRIVVRGGGHCFEGLVDDPAVQVLIDISEMNNVHFDEKHKAFSVEAGARLGHVYRTLYLNWGVTVPGGSCPGVGVGGHVSGGGYGMLSHRDGLVVDHLYGVEVVVVDKSGRARIVVATREAGDPHRDLWWAHTGGGGGNFGIVTRYLFRAPDATGNTPETLLPKPPAQVLVTQVHWSWPDLTEATFNRLVSNYGRLQRAAAGPANSPILDSSLTMFHADSGTIQLFVTADGTDPNAEGSVWAFVQAVGEGVGPQPFVEYWVNALWMRMSTSYDSTPFYLRFKSKAGYLREPWSDRQISAIYRYLAQTPANAGSAVYLLRYGGKINSVRPDATATPHRDSCMIAFYDIGWYDPAEDAARLASIRGLYQEVYSDTGGVPAPNTASDGAYINYPDTDLADPALNTSGIPWHTLYYKDNYPKLQQVKAKWDPRNVFQHALSVQPPGVRARDLAAPASPAAPASKGRVQTPAPKSYPKPKPPRHVGVFDGL
ncbi:FAD-binding oxidoreductase [Sinosporangium siamense]|uniref:FAD-linked oxidase n=1 Tax=Sinosporangium siamense TaxID=1367973 RepID=A0A919RF97_9ACTN|nr:FAD-binding protein [Sinosporangium siamense]GII90699.1 FAD-linked oxidase [Sinosporangium siamense]